MGYILCLGLYLVLLWKQDEMAHLIDEIEMTIQKRKIKSHGNKARE